MGKSSHWVERVNLESSYSKLTPKPWGSSKAFQTSECLCLMGQKCFLLGVIRR